MALNEVSGPCFGRQKVNAHIFCFISTGEKNTNHLEAMPKKKKKERLIGPITDLTDPSGLQCPHLYNWNQVAVWIKDVRKVPN